MNNNYILARWHHTIPRSRWVVDDFLKFTKAHMDEQWLDIVIMRVGGHIGRRGANHAVSRLCKRGLLIRFAGLKGGCCDVWTQKTYECTNCECAKKERGSSSDYGGSTYSCQACPATIGGSTSVSFFREIPEYPKTPEWCPLLPEKVRS